MQELVINNIKELDCNNLKGIKKIVINDNINNVSSICDVLENVNSNINVLCNIENEINEEFRKRDTFQGFNTSILNRVKKICNDNVCKDDYVVDMTVGNGQDTLFLCNIAKKVFGFDIQEQAIINTNNLLKLNNKDNYELFLESHVNIDKTLKDYNKNIKLVLFNLGYLPGYNKGIMTKANTTLEALIKAREMIRDDGLILIVFYPHPEGVLEYKTISKYLNDNNISYQIFRNTDKTFAPFLMVVRK